MDRSLFLATFVAAISSQPSIESFTSRILDLQRQASRNTTAVNVYRLKRSSHHPETVNEDPMPEIRGGPDWTMKRDMMSPRYTTHWDELPLVKAA